ncbi:flagellin [Niveibacterium sp. 24ML]|uniref:flagellin N-terminal helical domain-containing protein n=1 Tax=Niveibacterium sp. 24ML TaxID=2985512 RepID=UPI0022721F57|nr:flagellin [Niveibacterium sp. 24ML]MCX9156149.1 flagellin [Niveibacterium sp. 24ML]
MALTINTNVYSLNAQRNLNTTQTNLANPLQRLSSGLRINSSADDAAGLAISERIGSTIRGQNVAMRNANDAISMVQVADGTASKISDNLQRMRELAVQAANGTYTSSDRANISVEFVALQKEITRIAQNTKFNNLALTNSSAQSFSFQVGAQTSSDNQISVTTKNLQASSGLSVGSSNINVGGAVKASAGAAQALAAIAAIDKAINTVTTNRADFGAAINRTQAVISNLSIAVENQSAARGRIVDADFAAETANLTRLQILQQAGTAILAQANAIPQQALSLLR